MSGATPALSSFAEIPGEVARRVGAGERVLLILLDAFGLTFLRRHERHPLVRRLQVTPLTSQFPSTTTAHLTTLNFGLPVAEHGLYEWHVREPTLDAIVCPLRYTTYAGTPLEGRLPPGALAPGPTFYEQLGTPSLVLLPRSIEASTYTRMATRGASLIGYPDLTAGVRAALDALGSRSAAYAHLYWEKIDTAGHLHGPSSAQFAAESVAALDAVEAALSGAPPGISVLFTADHGQLDVSPDRTDYLDELWPELTDRLRFREPAGSARDLFLHLRPGSAETVIAELAARLGHRAEVRAAAELFPEAGPRLRARLADVVVLPAPGRQVWLRCAGEPAPFRGHHGGLDPDETGTYLAELRT